MVTSFYTAASGVIQQQKGLDVTANNIANVNTNGYKPSDAVFTDLLYTRIREEGNEVNYPVGHGVRLEKTDNLTDKQGSMLQTGHTYDFAIAGKDGFFAVETEDGIKYTRNGNFELTLIDGEYYLTASGKGNVLDSEGEPIVVDIKAAEDLADADGQEQESGEKVLDIGVYTCPNIDGLLRGENLFYSETENSGEMEAVENPSVLSGYLEGSAVDLADEMKNMILSQRAFQLNSRLVQVADEVMQTMNNLR